MMKRAHIIGIGGIAMSAIAQSLIKTGYQVTGSDLHHNELIDKLKQQGVAISIGHGRENINTKLDKIIFSDAIPANNIELVTAKDYGLEILGRSQALAWITEDKKVISAAGTHGKTTTSALIATLLEGAQKEPSFIIGGILNDFNSNFRASSGDYFILEGDEYGKSFLKYPSDIGVITNIEYDHPDIYADLEEMLDTYRQYICNLRECLITNSRVLNLLDLDTSTLDLDIITIGINDDTADYNIIEIQEEELSSYFKLAHQGNSLGRFKINALGDYNIKHAVEAMAVGNYIGLSLAEMKEGLELWKGVKRRFEILKDNQEEVIITDYAHHPSEVKAVAKILGRIKTDKKKVLIFQPHQYIRTNSLFEEYHKILNFDIDEQLICKIYKVRERVKEEELDSLGRELSEIISVDQTKYYNNWEELSNYLNEYKEDNNAIYLFLGAGSIDDFARKWAHKS